MLKVVMVVIIIIIFKATVLTSSDFADYNDNDLEDEEEDFHMLITGGYRPTKNTMAKYLVSIRTSRPTAYFGDNHYCVGSLIASNLVLTAAHCVVDSNRIVTRSRRIIVVAGTPNRLRENPKTVELEVEAVIPHNKFIRSSGNDIAILRLKQSVPNDNDAIKIIPLAHRKPAVGTNCTVVGWGQLLPDGPFSAEAVYVDLTITSDKQCQDAYSSSYSKGMICANGKEKLFQGPCRGDSGAPLICRGRVCGIVSWGVRCSKLGFPTAFTDVAYHYQWIQKVNGVILINYISYTLLLVCFFINRIVL
ncbi:trypsin I-P1-like isoform X2 [Teleopsis dalmanni]|uniref:trypsin I-P1-like isoform X2 n=1 Tax=Teleopsis dalmanni TaxID=139649 RepID=UPI0018CCEAF2|nr:trypsin I-P1-like isoform X2 [Teleopsis dalmanni]XP_037934887.1 trypsin I-P1-like isoform X2 [Teleopsis dalmanni]